MKSTLSQTLLFRIAGRIAGLRLGDRKEEVVDDLLELYDSWRLRYGGFRAGVRLALSSFDILFLGLGERQFRIPQTRAPYMIKCNFKLAVRSLKKRPGYAGITVTGLAVGMACCLLIVSYARQQWTYDSFHDDPDTLYRINIDAKTPGGERILKAGQPIPLAAELISTFADVVAAVPVIVENGVLIESEQDTFEDDVIFTDGSFFDVFTIPFIHGSPEKALSAPESVVLTESAAMKYFGGSDALNQNLRVSSDGRLTDRIVSGVVQDPPGNSSVRFSILQPIAEWSGYDSLADAWTSWVTNTYVRLVDADRIAALERGLGSFAEEHYAPMIETWKILQWISRDEDAFKLQMQSLTDIHFTPQVEQAQFASTDPRFPLFLMAVALGVLLIACVNFMTLSLGQATRRAREVGMRKVLGAARMQLMNQFWSEALLTSGIALLLGIILSEMAVPVFSELTGSPVSIDYDWTALGFFLGLLLVTGILAGAYPAFYLTRFRAKSMAHLGGTIGRGSRWMQSLIVFQFTLSITFIVAVLVVSAQLRFLRNTELGFDREQLIVAETYSTDPSESERLVENLRSEWSRIPGVAAIAASSSGFNRHLGWSSFGSVDGEAHLYYDNRIDRHYLRTMGMNVVEGQAFTDQFPQDPDGVLLVNEALVRDFEWDDPIGQRVGNAGKVAGVVSDFYFKSLHTIVEPMALFLSSKGDDPFRYIYVRLEGQNVAETISALEAVWKKVAPDRPFRWNFLDDDLDRQYASEQRLQNLVSAAGVFAIVIACMGLFGLAAFASERRTKEIGIRKVVGAGIPSIVLLVSREFLILIGIATFFATPLAWIYLNRWLDEFANRIEMSLWMPILATILALIIAMLTVSYHAVRAATANPVSSLRSE